jgi:hypothetical protein
MGLVVSSGDVATPRDQTAPLATIGANSSASSATPILQALAQLSETMIMLTGAGELGHARAVHEAIGKLLIRRDGTEPGVIAPSIAAPMRATIPRASDASTSIQLAGSPMTTPRRERVNGTQRRQDR